MACVLTLAGLVWSLRPNDIDVQLLTTSRQLMQQLETETGVHPGWINNGGLFIASNKERLAEYKRLMTASLHCNGCMIVTYLFSLVCFGSLISVILDYPNDQIN